MTVSSSTPSYQAWVELRPPLSILSVSFLPTRRRTPRGQPCSEREDRRRARVAGGGGDGGGDRGGRLQREGVPQGRRGVGRLAVSRKPAKKNPSVFWVLIRLPK